MVNVVPVNSSSAAWNRMFSQIAHGHRRGENSMAASARSGVGVGLGGALLTDAVRRAWANGARRVWLHTCNLDHPHALAHYRARGFSVCKVEETEEEIPVASPSYWQRT